MSLRHAYHGLLTWTKSLFFLYYVGVAHKDLAIDSVTIVGACESDTDAELLVQAFH